MRATLALLCPGALATLAVLQLTLAGRLFLLPAPAIRSLSRSPAVRDVAAGQGLASQPLTARSGALVAPAAWMALVTLSLRALQARRTRGPRSVWPASRGSSHGNVAVPAALTQLPCSRSLTAEMHEEAAPSASRRLALASAVAGAVGCPMHSWADDKLRNLPPERLAEIIAADVSERAFMVSADLTRAVYDEACTFTDEIDTYEIDKFIKGTKALFLGPPYSKLALTSPVEATANDVKFTFSEELVFNIPFKPIVSLTGRMEMKRGPDGLITSYREYWDGGVGGVLRTVRLSGL